MFEISNFQLVFDENFAHFTCSDFFAHPAIRSNQLGDCVFWRASEERPIESKLPEGTRRSFLAQLPGVQESIVHDGSLPWHGGQTHER